MFLGSDHGIYRSTNTGVSFSKVLPNDGYTTALTVAPSDSNRMWAAQSPSYGDCSSPAIFKSTDRGANWTVMSTDLPDSIRILKIRVHPTDTTTVYALTGGDETGINPFVSTTSKRRLERNPWLYKSTDRGAHWTKIGPNSAADSIWDFAIDPSDPSIIWVTTKTDTSASLDKTGGTWKSTDGGSSWSQKFHRTGCLAIKADEPDTVRVVNIYAGSHSPSNALCGVWETKDGGSTWSRRSFPGESTPSPWGSGWQDLEDAYGKSSYGIAPTIGQSMKTSAADDILWVTSQFAYRSTDGGDTFNDVFTNSVSAPSTWLTRGLENVTVASIYASESTQNLLFQGYHDLGIWRSTDGGAS
jgi:hypothetical protein